MTRTFQEYPKCKYNDPTNHESCIVVNNREEEDALGPEWKDHWLECAAKAETAEGAQSAEEAPAAEEEQSESEPTAEEPAPEAAAAKPKKSSKKKAK